ncbi:R3H domain-containing nucleic acid-binding protein [Frigoribacterium sp. VKM Ac-2530]|uniref:Jag family protein n=1 Tax=Frigoribacterium sp. VKM Ac-2530 TaxID=2783822 RepID=UPI00188C9CD5|nr:R3H domain-containing nucleic acid-binding protein [Frigoribacterium sp. VKM Ac-2530]MBF4580764.1 DNA-binding protein [Frigoribacterium sp. VKM Ac-2530]
MTDNDTADTDTSGADLPEGTAAAPEEATVTDDRQRTSGAAASVDGADAASVIDEGEIAADYIEELLDICDFDGDIDIEVRGGRSYISVDASGEGSLRTLSKPDTVTALQELTRIAVQTKTGEFSRLILDIGGSRQTREAELGAMVDRAVERLEEGAEAASLPPMSSYERKLVHDIVAARGFVSESEGEGRDRHTVIKRG